MRKKPQFAYSYYVLWGLVIGLIIFTGKDNSRVELQTVWSQVIQEISRKGSMLNTACYGALLVALIVMVYVAFQIFVRCQASRKSSSRVDKICD